MIVDQRQREVALRKMARLETSAAEVEARLHSEPRDATHVTLQSYRRLINQLKEEIARYDAGVAPRPKHLILDEDQIRNTRRKLDSLERRHLELQGKTRSPAQELSLVSLRRTINQLKEEITWSEVHRSTCRVVVEGTGR